MTPPVDWSSALVYVSALVFGYLLGSIPFGLILAKLLGRVNHDAVAKDFGRQVHERRSGQGPEVVVGGGVWGSRGQGLGGACGSAVLGCRRWLLGPRLW